MITFSGKHGTYQSREYGLDATMEKYLPASPASLRAIIEERSPECDWSDIRTVSAALIVLADFDGYSE